MEILNGNGADLPEALRHLPPGRYVLEAIDEAPVLTEARDRDLRAAVQAADADLRVDGDVAEARLESRLRR